ncbi:MAG: hypothetical protein HQ481_10005 [Alphaproteobacteria bacterium]|nr:hypothetical protein [Alphaproteobacteria bacterium]
MTDSCSGHLPHGYSSTGTSRAVASEFDPRWYLEQHDDVAALIEKGWYLDPFHHYVMAGCSEGKSPNEDFQEKYYQDSYPDIVRALEAKVFSCGFEHYLKHGRAEGRRARPATRAALVDLTQFGSGMWGAALQERILFHLAGSFRRLSDWDFWLLTRETNNADLSRLDGVNVSRICVDQVVGDIVGLWEDLPIMAFLAPLGPSDYYGAVYRTTTILPDLNYAVGDPADRRRNATDLERALAISEAVICLTLSDRTDLINRWKVEPDRVTLLHLPPSSCIEGEPRLPMVVRAIAGKPFLLTDLMGGGASSDLALQAATALAALPSAPALVAVVSATGAADLTARAQRSGLADALVLVEEPTAATWRWLVENCRSLVETDRQGVTSGLLEDALGMVRPLICARQSPNLRVVGDAAFRFDDENPATLGRACEAVLRDDAAAEATRSAIAKQYPDMAADGRQDLLKRLFERFAGAGRDPGPPREVLLGLREGNRIHSSFSFAVPPSAAGRSLLLEIAVPADYPEPGVLVVASAAGLPDVQEPIERGRSARISITLPKMRGGGRVVTHAMRDDGTIVKSLPGWPDLELRSASIMASSVDILRSVADIAPGVANGGAVVDTEAVLSSINAVLDTTAPALNMLDAEFDRAFTQKPALRLTVPPMPSIQRAIAPVALHLTRHQFTIAELKFHGSNKDQAARQQYFRDRGFQVITEAVYDWQYDPLIDRLTAERHADPQVIVVEAMLHHPLMRFLRERYPRAKLLIRSHNAEVLHRIHTHTATLMMEHGSAWAWLNPRDLFTRGTNIFNHWQYDRNAIDVADHILSISEWETKRYWPYLGPSNKVSTVPYFLPRDLIYDGPIPDTKPHSCVCLTSASPGPIIYDALRNFVRLVDSLDDADGWEFPVTGALDDRYAVKSERCRFLGHVENPIELMSQASSMALLSPYGYGFKTKVLDAIMAACYTLMPQSLIDRHPAEVRPYCVPVDLGSPASFKAALERTLEPFPHGDPNEALRERAYAAMDAILGIG